MPAIEVRSGRARKPKKVRVGQNIVLSERQHEKLADYLKNRMDSVHTLREANVERLREIDREINGYLVRDEEDKQRDLDNKMGKGVKAVDEKLPLAWAQLDECMTYMATVLAPDEGIYTAMAPVEQQAVAKGFSALMNQHAEKFNHYAALLRMIFDALKYNEGAVLPMWREMRGNRVKRTASGAVTITNDTVYMGNELRPVDMYNLIYDASVPLAKVHCDGEYFAVFDMITAFRALKSEADGEIWNADRFIMDNWRRHYYREKPVIGSQVRELSGVTDWYQILGTHGGMAEGDGSTVAIERGQIYMWLKPKEWGLSDSADYEIWRFTTMHRRYVVNAVRLSNAHGMLPLCATRPINDGFNWQTRSFGDLLTPMNRFASFEINVHQRAVRKELVGGVTIYNPEIIPLLGQADADMAGSKIPTNSTAQDINIRNHVVQLNDSPDTSNIANNLEMADGIMQKILPTDQARQVAGLERATQYQAAAMVQSSHRRNLMYAKFINGDAMVPCRHIQMMNIFQFQQRVRIIDPQTGRLTEIDPTEFSDLELEFQVADGLRGIDKTALILHSRDTLNSLLQSNQAGQVDIVSLINHISTLWGDNTDWSQFKFQSPIDGLSPEQKQMAFELLQRFVAGQQAGGGGGQGGTGEVIALPGAAGAGAS